MKKYISMFIMAGLCSSAIAGLVTTADINATSAPDGVSTDAFEGATVTANSPLHPVGNNEGWFSSPHAGDTLFADGGGMRFIDFNVADQLSLTGLTVNVVADWDEVNGTTRQIMNLKLYASDAPGTVLDNLVADIAIDHQYVIAYGSKWIEIDVALDSVTGQYFRVEVVQPQWGSRVWEIDGFGTVIPEPATMGLFGLMGGGLLWARKRFMI